MKIDVLLEIDSLRHVPAAAREVESLGFAALWVPETRHNPFLQLALAAEHTERAALGTAIAVAFPRSPTVLAHIAWDLQAQSGGRFILGLGSQVKGHIERRFGMSWDPPVEKMRETILALRALWDCWQNSTRLDFQGKFYKLTLMTPFFNPGPIEHPEVPIFISAVNKGMCRLAGELCDGIHVHPLHSARYIEQAIIPALRDGATKAQRAPERVQLVVSPFIIAGENEAEIAKAREIVRSRIAFYASTRTYRAVLEMHGWGETCLRLHRKSALGRWNEMPEEITDEMLEAFAVTGKFHEIRRKLELKYSGLADRLIIGLNYRPDDSSWKKLAEAVL